MAKLHRKELKQDEIRETMAGAVRKLSLHGREMIYIITIIIAVGFIAFAWSYYERRQEEQSQNLLGTALEKLEAPVGEAPEGTTIGTERRYKTEKEKYTDAFKDFELIIQKYGNTPAAEMARYHAGVAAFYLKDYRKSEDLLKQSSRISDRNILYYLSRIALANLYQATEKPEQAVPLLNEAIEKNQGVVPTENLLMEVAESYEKAGKNAQARQHYQRIVNEYKDSPVSYQAQLRLNEIQAN